MPGYRTLLNYGNAGPAAAANTFTTMQDISPTPQYTPPTGYLIVNRTLKLRAHGIFSTTGTPTLQLAFYWGGAASGIQLAATTAVTTGSGAASWPWDMEYIFTVRATGTSGSVWGHGWCDFGTAVGAVTRYPLPAGAADALVTVNTTTSNTITTAAAWGTSSVSNTITVEQFYVEDLTNTP